MKKIFKHFQKRHLLLIIAFFLISFFFVLPVEAQTALATVGGWVTQLFGWLFSALVWILGNFLMVLIRVLVYIAQYNNFIGSEAVIRGWSMVRDLANMFFVVILLIIAFATILRIEKYNYKKWLPKLVLMAVLINFSKTICGLMIDVAQVVMLSFVNSFKNIGGTNISHMLGISQWAKLGSEGGEIGEGTRLNNWDIIAAYFLALVYVVISIVVIGAMLMVLVMRIIMIWIYVILSPLAFLLGSFPGGQGYASKWWNEFTNNLIIGPVLAFFIWLSFVAIPPSLSGTGVLGDGKSLEGDADFAGTAQKDVQPFGTSDLLVQFIVSIGLLIGGLKVAQEIGGVAGSWAGKGMTGINKLGGYAKKFGRDVLTGDNLLARKAARHLFKADFRPVTIASSIRSSYQKAKKDDEKEIRLQGTKSLRRGGARSVFGGVGAGQSWGEAYWSIRGGGRAFKEIFVSKGKRRRKKEEIEKLKEIANVLKEKLDLNYPSGQESQAVERKEKINKKIEDFNSESVALELKIKNEDELIQKLNREIKDLEVKVNSQRASEEEEKNFNNSKDQLEKTEEGREKMKSRKKEIEEEVEGLEKTKENIKIIPDREYEELKKEKTLNKRNLFEAEQAYARVLPPQALESRSEYRSLILEAKRKYDNITEEGEKRQLFEDAVKRKDKIDQIAIMESLMQDVNFNELLKSRGYNQDGLGMIKFLHNEKNEFGEKNGIKLTGFDEQQKLMVQNDLSELAMRTAQWDYAKTVGVNSVGERYSLIRKEKDSQGREYWNDDDHVDAAATDAVKSDPQRFVAGSTRFTYGGEDMNGDFKVSNLGKVLIKLLDSQGVFDSQAKRIRPEVINTFNQPQVRSLLEQQLKVDEKTLKVLEERKGKEESGVSPVEIRQYLNNIDALDKESV